MVKEIIGDLIAQGKNKEFDVICQGCNIYNTMGAGIAKIIKQEFPEAYKVDCETIKGDESKLGTISFTKHTIPIIANLYTQKTYGGKTGTVYADYPAIEKALSEVKKTFPGKKIGLPKIGAGLAAGDWSTIKKIILSVFNEDTDNVTIVYLADDIDAPGVSGTL